MQQQLTLHINDPKCWVEVILPFALPKVFTYHIDESVVNKIKPGCRVEVVFGKKKKYAGVVKKISFQNPGFPTKEIVQILDEEPILFEHQLKLWNWISRYYLCSEGEVMAAALPANFKLSSETIVIYNEEFGDDFSGFSDNEFIVAEALLIKRQLNLTEVQQILDANYVYPVIKKLLDRKVCFVWEKISEKYKPLKEKVVLLSPSYNNEEKLSALLNEWKGAPKQMELLLAYLYLQKTEGEVLQVELLKKSGATSAQLKSLCTKGILIVESRNANRIGSLPKSLNLNFSFTPAQSVAYDWLNEQMNIHFVTLLQGITGSGKTLLYVKKIAEYVLEGKQVLYLLPEIALTSQVIRRLQVFFGGYISIYHSKFNDQERIELWNKVRSGDTRIILGARSSLFLPFENLGLIIVDEEHDSSFKQHDPAPRYNARDTAIYYASAINAKVILGSATPSVESYFNARQGKYGLVKLSERYMGIELPLIEIINTAAISSFKKVTISEQLKTEINKVLSDNSQVILFQNRRGYDPYIICGSCGFIPKCSHCDVSLTMHKFSNKMHCHYCGNTYAKFIECPACNSTKWLEKNFGTEKVEEDLDIEFPDYKVARMDVDSVRGKRDHDNLIQLFENRRIDILVGTQMVVKGLDFEHVNLVGILDADGLLSFTDFRVNERAFQLMEQVSGRAGRKHRQGKVLIQAMNTKHPVLQFVQQHDYDNFFQYELERRREFNYPPFVRLVNIILKHKDRAVVETAANVLAATLKQDITDINGPAAPVISKIRNMFIREMLVKLPKNELAEKQKKVIINHINLLLSDKRFNSVHIILDVDPA